MRLNYYKYSLADVIITILFILSIGLRKISGFTIYIQTLLCLIFILVYLFENRIAVNKYICTRIGFLLWALMSLLWAFDIDISLKPTLSYVSVTLFTIVIYLYGCMNRHKTEHIMRLYIISSFMLLVNILINVPLSYFGVKRIGVDEFGISANNLGMVFSFATILSLYMVHVKKRYNYSITTFLFCIMSLFTGSRKAIIILIVGSITLILLQCKEKKEIIINIIRILIIMVIFFYIIYNNDLLYSVIGKRLDALIEYFTSNEIKKGSIYDRVRYIDIGINLIINKPVIGYGFESFVSISGTNQYSHSNYIELLVNGGVIALLLYYYIYIITLIKAIRSRLAGSGNGSLNISLLLCILLIDFATSSSYKLFYTQSILALAMCLNET